MEVKIKTKVLSDEDFGPLLVLPQKKGKRKKRKSDCRFPSKSVIRVASLFDQFVQLECPSGMGRTSKFVGEKA
jgi:hypothetical protein